MYPGIKLLYHDASYEQEAASSQKRYEEKLYDYVLQEQLLIRQKEVLEERKRKILSLKDRYKF